MNIISEGVSETPVDGNALLAASEASTSPTPTTTSTPTGTGSLIDQQTGGSTSTTPTSTQTGSPWALNEKGEFGEGWLDRLPEEFKNDKQTLGRFKDPAAMAKTLVNQQRLLGKQANAIIMPNEKSSPEEWAEFNAKRGVPESADKYPTEINDLPEGVKLDTAQVKDFNALAHKTGMTPAQAQETLKHYATLEASRLQSESQLAAKEYEAGKKALGEAWGDKFETNMAVVKRACQVTGLDPNTKGLSDPAVVVALERFARMVSDDKIVNSDSTATFMAGAAKARDIQMNPQNPYHARYVDGDKEINKLVLDLYKNG
jgi:hypothetical protein